MAPKPTAGGQGASSASACTAANEDCLAIILAYFTMERPPPGQEYEDGAAVTKQQLQVCDPARPARGCV